MNASDQTHGERRKNPRSTMSADQFQEFTMQSLEEGKKQFSAIDSRLDTMAGHMETMSKALIENTELTKQTAVLAQKTAEDTADLVKISKFGKKVSIWGRLTAAIVAGWGRWAAAFVAGCVQWASRLSKLLAPIMIVIAIATAIYHGDKITWKTIFEVISK
jgi:hypothetical protein